MKFPMRPVSPVILALTPEQYWIQIKYNGWNIIIDEGKIFTRRGKDITHWNCWGNLNLTPSFPVNGELISINERQYDIQTIRTGRMDYKIMAFDIMIEQMPIEERLDKLRQENLGEKVKICQTIDGNKFKDWEEVNLFLKKLLASGKEGIVLKKKKSFYHIGDYDSVNFSDWIKLKTLVDII